jgi:hypothetical protein
MDFCYQEGQFVWCLFPFRERPLKPGPVEHVGYVGGAGRMLRRPHVTVMTLYTTTKVWPETGPLPRGLIAVDGERARRMGQKPFVLDARRIAFLPFSSDFFPRLESADRGVIAEAPPDLRLRIRNTVSELVRRPDLVVRLGPDKD